MSIFEGLIPTGSEFSQAIKLQEVAKSVGFDWPTIWPVFNKLIEEINELKAEIHNKAHRNKILDEFGDILFVCANLARHLNIQPEKALQHANKKFIQRFSAMEKLITAAGTKLSDTNLSLLNVYWEKAKRQETL